VLLDGSLAEGSQFELLVGEEPEIELDPDGGSEPADAPAPDAVDGEVLVARAAGPWVLVVGEDCASPESAHAGDSVNVRAGPKEATSNVEVLVGSASVT
jgi:hypothetical protein